MMNDLISRQDAIEVINGVRIRAMDNGEDVSRIWECADAILQMHSAKSKVGKWALHDGYYCTLCGYKLVTTAIPDRCPSCMADMR